MLVILSVVGKAGSEANSHTSTRASPEQQSAELEDGGHRQETRIRHFASEIIVARNPLVVLAQMAMSQQLSSHLQVPLAHNPFAIPVVAKSSEDSHQQPCA
jgi:hypothetical protein